MDSLTSVSKPSIVFPPSNPLLPQRPRLVSLSLSSPASDARLRPRLSSFFPLPCAPPHLSTRRFLDVSCKSGAHDDADDLERALHLDGTIPGTSNEFVKRVSSRAYDMRRHLHQTFDSSSYDVLDANPWRETSKPVYVLTQKENQLCTMKTRRNRSEVERELGLLFSKGGKWRSKIGNQAKQSKTGTKTGTKFQMLVEDIREGVLASQISFTVVRNIEVPQLSGYNKLQSQDIILESSSSHATKFGSSGLVLGILLQFFSFSSFCATLYFWYLGNFAVTTPSTQPLNLWLPSLFLDPTENISFKNVQPNVEYEFGWYMTRKTGKQPDDVFEDESEAAKYCDLLQGGGQGCEGVAEIDASSVFDLCQKMRALAVLFRRGRTPPLPESLRLNLRARKRSLEDQEDLI
ncbi:hypothetical protein CK203_048298 [Vitis vinifera]|uniref:Uncharacterized protein n=1 Tax=Vitis vinifera TaxID=29760 RepID=A0A438H121_VITVI|nr:hypothetical protein CK203_048298 [Vitis vinifera]